MRVCAIMSSYNEVDIIQESISKLIKQDIDVYLLDNGSTDGTVEKASHFLNQGLINIETCIFKENEKEVYDWTSILKRKEEISLNLSYEWFLHVDADEIRYSPWPNKNLNEGIAFVDMQGYNLINFKLFNFRLVENLVSCENYEDNMIYYSDVEQFNRMQVKAWKKSEYINLHDHGGHLAKIPSPKIFPIRFIHKHFPIRSVEQGVRKILNERLERYSYSDRRKGWHVQYDHLNISQEKLRSEIIWDSNSLRKFDGQEIYNEILFEASQLLSYYAGASNLSKFNVNYEVIKNSLKLINIDSETICNEIIKQFELIIFKMKKGQIVTLNHNDDLFATLINSLIENQAMADYARGDPTLFDNSKFLKNA